MNININLQSHEKKVFIRNTPVTVNIVARRKSTNNFFRKTMPYIYTINLKHGAYEWKMNKTFLDIKKSHEVLAKLVKEQIGEIKFAFKKSYIKSLLKNFIFQEMK